MESEVPMETAVSREITYTTDIRTLACKLIKFLPSHL
jgi:hypothetical protein